VCWKIDIVRERLMDEGGVIDGEAWEHGMIGTRDDGNVLDLMSGCGEKVIESEHG
jgi:hypothetical protein